MTVISASRRTDIPAFYAEWFLNRVRAGFCHWSNPFSGQIYRAALAPDDVTAFVFWTRNPRPLMRHLPELDARGYRYYFHVTLTGYGRPLETHNPNPEAVIAEDDVRIVPREQLHPIRFDTCRDQRIL